MLNLDDNPAKYYIQAFKPGTFQINQQLYHTSIIISANELIDAWPPQQINELKSEHLITIASSKPTILLIGTGAKLQFPAIETYGELINLGIGVEIMDTAAACRTFNALTSEQRNVIAALIIN
jgi:uncharacterized protein